MEKECHVVHCFGSVASPDDTVVGDVIQCDTLVLLVLDVHESWHQFWNVNLSELLPLQFLDGGFGALIEKD